ncbi:MAG: ATP12 family protein [Alphaproteobacteria bacterium]
MPPPRVKRFYETAAAVNADGGYHIALDGKPVRTPGGQTVLLANRALADALAAEWDAQRPHIDLPRMGLNQLVNAAIDRGRADRAALADELIAYGNTDLLCYRAEGPPALVARQTAAWDPVLDWAGARYGVRLKVTSGIVAIEQDAPAMGALGAEVLKADPFQLTALRAAVGICGSLIVGLAAAEGCLDAGQAWRTVNVDEDWQREKWGEDPQAVSNRADAFAAFSHAVHMLRLLQVLESESH